MFQQNTPPRDKRGVYLYAPLNDEQNAQLKRAFEECTTVTLCKTWKNRHWRKTFKRAEVSGALKKLAAVKKWHKASLNLVLRPSLHMAHTEMAGMSLEIVFTDNQGKALLNVGGNGVFHINYAHRNFFGSVKHIPEYFEFSDTPTEDGVKRYAAY